MELEQRSERSDRRVAGATAILFALVAVLAAIDLAADAVEGTTLFHVVVEGGVIAVGLAGLVVMGRRFLAAARRERALVGRLEATREEAERWRREAGDLLRGLGASIDAQLDRWQLTPAEKEVALLLLKGLSSKEIAAVRGVSEPTVRQQARAVYGKAGLGGRSELAAFFLEDLLLPGGATAAGAGPAGGTRRAAPAR